MEFDEILNGAGDNPVQTHPIVFGFYVEYTYYPNSGKMYQNKCVPAGSQYKKPSIPKVKEQIKLNDVVETKPAWK